MKGGNAVKVLSIGLSIPKEEHTPEKNQADIELYKKNALDNNQPKILDGINKIKMAMEKSLAGLANEGFVVKTEEVLKGGYLFLECHIEEGELSFQNYERIKEILRKCVADFLSRFIINSKEDTLIDKIIKKNYTYLSLAEHEILTTITKKTLREFSQKNDAFNVKKRRGFIRHAVLEYLDTYHELTLDGFINFRLKKYRQKLEEVIDAAADYFMMEEEYKEFIRVLRCFVDIQPPRTEEVHVVIDGNGTFKILDKIGNLINTQYLGNIVTQKSLRDDIEIISSEQTCFQYKTIKFKQTEFRPKEIINYEDALISVLITIAPNNIMVHSSNFLRDKKIIETIKSVFADKMLICKNCDICRGEKMEKG
jgi:putative sporulation protein YtxC